MPDLEIALVEGSDAAAVARDIDAALIRYNEAVAGKLDIRPLVLALRDANGLLVGGLYGDSFWNVLHIDRFWIAESQRRRGHGRRLIHEAERQARSREVELVHLDTFSFQAPGFYERLGYRRFGELHGIPAGAARYFYAKSLAASSQGRLAR